MTNYVSLAQLGNDLGESPSNPHAAQTGEVVAWPSFSAPASSEPKDHFIERNGLKYAGTHLILDLWGAKHSEKLEVVEQAMRGAVEAAGATLLHLHLHHFTPNGGISGVAVLAESHISIHTWPEKGFVALDVFMCGDAKPHKAIEVFAKAFQPDRVMVNEQLRGGHV